VAGKKLLDVDALLRIARVGRPVASSTGAVAFNVTRPIPEENKDQVELWVVWPDGSRTYYTGEGDAAPAWSPGGQLAFISRRGAGEKEKGVGVFVVGRGGDPRRVAWFRHGVWRLEWLGEGLLAVGSWEPEKGMYDPDGDYVATRRLPLWFNGQGLVAGRTRQIYTLDPDSGRLARLTSEPYGVSSYTACAGRLFYTVPLDWRDPTVHALRMVAPGGEPETLLEGYSIGGLACVGGTLYMRAHRREIGIASHDKLYRVVDGEAECLTCGVLDRNIWVVEEGPGARPLIVYADHGVGVPALVLDGRIEGLGVEGLSVHYASHGAGRIYLLASTATSPPDIYVLHGEGPERLTRFNAWVEEEYRLAVPKRLVVEAAGDVVEGWVLEPPEGAPVYGEKRPLALYIHGGPKGMYGPVFHPEHQLMAAQGFIVAYANPRGSDGYEEEFADIRGRYGEVDYEQLMAFLDRVVEEYPVDTGRMLVTGISYGGYMTNVVVTKTGRFAAAVPENGIADWIADYWAADIGYWFDPDQIGGTPLDNLEEYVRRSPAFHAANVETPVLTIHSLEDYRCFIDQALAMHTALSTLGKDSTLLVFTRGDHGHSVRAPPRHRRKRLEYKLSWIREKLGLDAKT